MEKYIETILRFRVYRVERMLESHGGGLRKCLIWSFDNLDVAWKTAKTEAKTEATWQTWTVEDHGETVRLEHDSCFNDETLKFVETN